MTSYTRFRTGKGIGWWWTHRIGKAVSSECPRFKEVEKTPEHIVVRCKEIVRIKDSGDRRK